MEVKRYEMAMEVWHLGHESLVARAFDHRAHCAVYVAEATEVAVGKSVGETVIYLEAYPGARLEHVVCEEAPCPGWLDSVLCQCGFCYDLDHDPLPGLAQHDTQLLARGYCFFGHEFLEMVHRVGHLGCDPSYAVSRFRVAALQLGFFPSSYLPCSQSHSSIDARRRARP